MPGPTVPARSSNQHKYESRNPVQRWLIARFQQRIALRLAPLAVRSILDVGCGEGYLARVLLDALPGVGLTGVDGSGVAIDQARRRCPEARFEPLRLDDLAHGPRLAASRPDLVVCSEVLEHLAAPRRALATLRALSPGYVLLTVPWEPWFQLANLARGRHLATLGNHPEHAQRWSLRGFVREASDFFVPASVEVCFPWILYLGRPRPGAAAGARAGARD